MLLLLVLKKSYTSLPILPIVTCPAFSATPPADPALSLVNTQTATGIVVFLSLSVGSGTEIMPASVRTWFVEPVLCATTVPVPGANRDELLLVVARLQVAEHRLARFG